MNVLVDATIVLQEYESLNTVEIVGIEVCLIGK